MIGRTVASLIIIRSFSSSIDSCFVRHLLAKHKIGLPFLPRSINRSFQTNFAFFLNHLSRIIQLRMNLERNLAWIAELVQAYRLVLEYPKKCKDMHQFLQVFDEWSYCALQYFQNLPKHRIVKLKDGQHLLRKFANVSRHGNYYSPRMECGRNQKKFETLQQFLKTELSQKLSAIKDSHVVIWNIHSSRVVFCYVVKFREFKGFLQRMINWWQKKGNVA